MNTITGWHFSIENKLRYDDSRTIVLGETLSIEPDKPVVPCQSGFHASELALNALRYAPGTTLWRVELSGDLQSHGKPVDKWVGRHRKAIAGGVDAKDSLLKFARDCALDVGHLWEMPAVVREFLETGNPELAKAAYNAKSAKSTYDAVEAVYYASYYANSAADVAYNAYNASFTAYNAAFYAAYYAAKASGDYETTFHEYEQKFENLCLNIIK